MKENNVIAAIVVLVLLWFSIPNLAQPLTRGSSHNLLEADEVEVGWFQANTPNGYQLTIEYSVEDAPVDIYIVSQDYYNATSKEIPTGYIHHEHGLSGIIVVQGPLPTLNIVYLSEVDQWLTSSAYVDSPYSYSVRTYGFHNLLIVVIAALIFGQIYQRWKDEVNKENHSDSQKGTETDIC